MTHANNAPWFTKAGAATSILPISHFVGPRTFALKGGGYGCLFSLEGIDPESRTDEDLDVRVRGVEGALRGLPQGACLYQYVRVISGFDLPRHEKYPSPVMESFASDRVKFLNQTARFRRIDLHWCLTIEPDTGNPLGRKPKEQRIATDRQLFDLEKAATILESHMSDSIGLTYDGKLYRIFEGSVFEGVVTNHIDGGLSGPILIMLTTDYYSHDHQQLLLPQGTRLIGSVQAVNSSQARKMVVAFHRAICPDGFSVDLDKFAGLDPLGTTGLATKVDNRYFQTFAVAAAIGGLGGLAQIGNNNILDPSAQIRNGVTSQTSEEGEQILNHFLNRLPIITLKEGSRARVYIGRDILIPSYAEHRVEPAM